MHQITLEQLEELLSLADSDKITAALKKLHFRQAGKYTHLEFPLLDILDAEKIGGTDSYEDVFTDKSYFAEMFQGVEGYLPYTFIVVTTLAIFRHLENLEFPERVDIYTNAPVNPRFEQEMAQITHCHGCKRTFPYGYLTHLNDNLLCKACFSKTFEKNRPLKRR